MLRLLFAGSKFRGECHPLHAGSYDEYGPQMNPKFTCWAVLVGCNFPLRQHGPSPPPQLHCHSKKGIAWASITVAPEPNSGDLNTSTGSEKTESIMCRSAIRSVRFWTHLEPNQLPPPKTCFFIPSGSHAESEATRLHLERAAARRSSGSKASRP